MPSQADLARSFGISRERVNQLVREGMPMNSTKAAELWRKERGLRRKPTNERKFAAEKKKAGRPRKPKEAPKSGDTLYDALQAAITIQEEAFRMAQEAMAAQKDELIAARLHVHTKALEARQAAEKSYREELERRSVLIPYAQAAEMFRKGFDFILNRMRRLPQALAPRCNPTAALMAFNILEREVNAIIADGQRQYSPNAKPIKVEPFIQPKPTNAEPTKTTDDPAK